MLRANLKPKRKITKLFSSALFIPLFFNATLYSNIFETAEDKKLIAQSTEVSVFGISNDYIIKMKAISFLTRGTNAIFTYKINDQKDVTQEIPYFYGTKDFVTTIPKSQAASGIIDIRYEIRFFDAANTEWTASDTRTDRFNLYDFLPKEKEIILDKEYRLTIPKSIISTGESLPEIKEKEYLRIVPFANEINNVTNGVEPFRIEREFENEESNVFDLNFENEKAKINNLKGYSFSEFEFKINKTNHKNYDFSIAEIMHENLIERTIKSEYSENWLYEDKALLLPTNYSNNSGRIDFSFSLEIPYKVNFILHWPIKINKKNSTGKEDEKIRKIIESEIDDLSEYEKQTFLNFTKEEIIQFLSSGMTFEEFLRRKNEKKI